MEQENQIEKSLEGRYRRLRLPDGNLLVIKFEDEGIVYDIWNHNETELVQEMGYDLYGEDVPVELIKE